MPRDYSRGIFVGRYMFKTSDLYFAAYLKVAGVPFVDTEWEGKRMYFLFEDKGSDVMRDLKKQYFADKAKVNAMSFVQAIKLMKNLTHQERK